MEKKSGSVWMLWFAVAVPFLAYVGSIGLAEAKRRGAPQIELEIEGYDPRDLLRGQYLQYRIATEDAEPESSREVGIEPWARVGMYRSYACAAPKTPPRWVVYQYDGARPPACKIDLPATFLYEAHRYYIQQDRGLKLEDAVREGRASVRVRIVSSKEVLVDDLLVDGAPIR